MIVLYDCMTNTTWSWWSSLPLHISRVKMSPFGCHLTNTYLPPYIQNVSFYRCTCVCKGKLTFFSFFNIFFASFPFPHKRFWASLLIHLTTSPIKEFKNNSDNNTPLGAKLGRCRRTIYSKLSTSRSQFGPNFKFRSRQLILSTKICRSFKT